MGKLIKNNVLNELDTQEWVKRLHSVQEYDWKVPKELAPHLRLGTLTSPPLAAEIIRFFTQLKAQVFDPFCGEGGILVGAAIAGRLAAGVDLYPENLETASKVGDHYGFPMNLGWWGTQCVDAVDWLRWQADERGDQFLETQDLLFTDPPWGIDHGRNLDKGGSVPFNMSGQDEKDIGSFKDYADFYSYIGQVAHYADKLLKPGAYALWWFGDRHKGGTYRVIGIEAQAQIEAQSTLRLKGVQHYVPRTLNVRRQVFGWGKAFVPLVDHASLYIYRKGG